MGSGYLHHSSTKKLIALLDCNNFYASCEAIFNPKLIGKPVVILSNNDGCVIARSNEAKALGIAMGAPAFLYKELFNKHNVYTLSSNFALYGDLSNRVMKIIAHFGLPMEIYSIDECFIQLPSVELALEIQQKIKKWIGIPTSIGIAYTKTLAKIANHKAKKTGQIESFFCETEINSYLKQLPVEEIWGVGKRKATTLKSNGIYQALSLKQANLHWIRKLLTVATEKTVLELRGIQAISLEELSPTPKSIVSSRSFGSEVKDSSSLTEAVVTFCAKAATKLRKQQLKTSYMAVFTNHFYEQCLLEIPSNDTPFLIKTASKLANKGFQNGIAYKKAGIMLAHFIPETVEQNDLFNSCTSFKGLDVFEKINAKFGKNTMRFASEGSLNAPWKSKQNKKSPCYTTKWEDLLEIQI